MAAPESTVIQCNFKIGGDLHNVYAASVDEMVDLLAAFEERVLPAIHSVAQKSNAVAAIAAPSVPTPVVARPSVPAPEFTGGSDTHLCDHGQPMKLVPAGVSKATGKPYRAFYACAQPRETQCGKRVTV